MTEEMKRFVLDQIKNHIHDGNFSERINIFDIFNNIQTVTSVPSGTPKNFYGQFNIFNGKLYFYDFTNAMWDVAGGSSVYAGAVDSGGTAINLPTGWTSTRTGAGQFTVTHNLGTSNYSAPAIPFGASVFPHLNAVNSNNVQYVFTDRTGGLADTSFYFTLVLM